MTSAYLLGAAILLPILSGLLLLFLQGKIRNRKLKCTFIFLAMAVTSAIVIRLILGGNYEFSLWQLTQTLDVRKK